MDEPAATRDNTALRDAMIRAQLTRDQLADVIRVDKKTVDRWLAGKATPQPTPAGLAANALGVAINELWPDRYPVMHPPSSGTLAISVYPGRVHVPASVWLEHFGSAHDAIDILVYGGTFLFDALPTFGRQLIHAANRDVRIRIAVGDPASAAVALRGREEGIADSLASRCTMTLRRFGALPAHDNITIRMHSATLYVSLFRVDDTCIANHHIYGSPASDNPTLIATRAEASELYDGYVESFDRVWNDQSTRPPIPH